MKSLASVFLSAALLYLMGCAAPKRDQFKINMATESDDGYSLAGVSVWHGETLLGKSTTSGIMDVVVEAAIGSQFELRFECPEGYNAVRESVLVPLRTATGVAEEGTATADYSVTLECRPQKRKAMLVVQSNMANVPIKIGKKTMGVTNSEGIAHIDLSMQPKEVFEVWLDSSTNEFLRPINPQFPLVMPDHDELFVVQESFRIEEPVLVAKKKKRRKKKKDKKEVTEKPTRPTMIGSGTQWGSVK